MRVEDAPQFLTFEALAQEITRYTYRPGWGLEVFNDPWEGPCLYVTMTLPDAMDPTGKATTSIRVRSAVPPIPSAEYFGHWLLWRLDQIERHECREFLRRDGEQLFNPHNPIEPGDPQAVAA